MDDFAPVLSSAQGYLRRTISLLLSPERVHRETVCAWMILRWTWQIRLTAVLPSGWPKLKRSWRSAFSVLSPASPANYLPTAERVRFTSRPTRAVVVLQCQRRTHESNGQKSNEKAATSPSGGQR